ncbi:unnamed protein product, partial [Prorocentrum cordatum]
MRQRCSHSILLAYRRAALLPAVPPEVARMLRPSVRARHVLQCERVSETAGPFFHRFQTYSIVFHAAGAAVGKRTPGGALSQQPRKTSYQRCWHKARPERAGST